MKITNEKMRDELTRLYTDYAREREKIEKDTSNPKILITKRGVGYYIAT